MKNNKQCQKETNPTDNNEISGTITFVDYTPEILMKYLTKKLPPDEMNTMKKVIQAYPVYQEELISLTFMLYEYDNDIHQVLDYAADFEIDFKYCIEEAETEIDERPQEQERPLENRQKQMNDLFIEEQAQFQENEKVKLFPDSQKVLEVLSSEWKHIKETREKIDCERFNLEQVQQKLDMERYHRSQSRQDLDQELYHLKQTRLQLEQERYHINLLRQSLETEKNNIKKLSQEIQEERHKYQIYVQQLEGERINFVQVNPAQKRNFNRQHHDSRINPSEGMSGRPSRSGYNFKKY